MEGAYNYPLTLLLVKVNINKSTNPLHPLCTVREFSYLSTRAETVITRKVRSGDIIASESKPYLIHVRECEKFGLDQADVRLLLLALRSPESGENAAPRPLGY